MVRKNEKQQLVSYDNSIQKSNELSMAKMNQGLTLNQMQLLAYAIYSTQRDGKTEFKKHEFQNKFGIKKYQTVDAKDDTQKVSSLQFSIEDLENDHFEFWNIFSSIKYKNGLFNFRWNEEFIPHILELKEKYILIDFTVTSNFKSGFSWILYDYVKAHYGNWYKELSKDALMKLFGVQNRVTYQRNTSDLKKMVLDVAIKEINDYTELEVWYTEKKVGNKITGFVLHWSTGEKVKGATQKQVDLLQEIYSQVEKNTFDYLTLKNKDRLNQAKGFIITLRDINYEVKTGLSIKKADEYIKESIFIYDQLETFLENNGKERDRSLYYNWLKEDK